jgi:uncharacterized metal-binding protein
MSVCSGTADTAEIGDRAVRQLHRGGAAKMYCLAGIGGHSNTPDSTTARTFELPIWAWEKARPR